MIGDAAWSYPHPIPEMPKIETLVCFFNERVDEIWVDGELMPRPTTRWSLKEGRIAPRAAASRPAE